MRGVLRWILLLGGLTACSVNEAQYWTEYCTVMEAYLEGPCDGFAEWSIAFCGEEERDGPSTNCAFDRAKATTCLENTWVCDDETGEIDLPEACAEVYICVEE